MKKIAPLLVQFVLTGCALNLLSSQSAYCRDQKAGLVSWFQESAQAEAAGKSPSGWATSPYNRENWDRYWNDRFYYVWTIGPSDCAGTYDGPFGPEIVRSTVGFRKQLGLPPINLDDRNQDKAIYGPGSN